MNRRPTGQRIARVMPLLPLGLAAALVACATELPTTAEIEAMDVVELESRTQRLVAFNGDSVRYYLDDVAITREEARAVEAENIASISVYRDDEGGRASEVRMTSRSGADSALSSDVLAEDRIAFRGASPPDSIVVELEMDSPEVVGYGVDVRPTTADPAASAGAAGAGLDFPGSDLSARAPAEPLYVIDGEVAEAADFNRLAPQTIASISVLKGASATATYGSRGANGVLLIATKRDGSAPPAQ